MDNGQNMSSHRQGMMEVESEEEVDILDMGEMNGHDATSGEDDQLLMRFCPHDSSMLYPKEEKRNQQLRYACRLCPYSEISDSPLIYRNRLKKEVGNVLHTVPAAVADDPTLPKTQTASCERCRHNEAVFFQSDAGNDSLALIFVCCNCAHKWVG